MYHEYFETLAIGIEVAKVKSVAVAETSTVEELAVVVDTCRAIYDFIETVAVYVTDSK